MPPDPEVLEGRCNHVVQRVPARGVQVLVVQELQDTRDLAPGVLPPRFVVSVPRGVELRQGSVVARGRVRSGRDVERLLTVLERVLEALRDVVDVHSAHHAAAPAGAVVGVMVLLLQLPHVDDEGSDVRVLGVPAPLVHGGRLHVVLVFVVAGVVVLEPLVEQL